MIKIMLGLIFLFMGLGSICMITRLYLNDVKSKLDELGLSMSFNNVFFLSANEEAEARERIKRQMVEDDLAIAREIVRLEFQNEVQALISGGLSRVEALEIVLSNNVEAKLPYNR
jgi:hypothetical protein